MGSRTQLGQEEVRAVMAQTQGSAHPCCLTQRARPLFMQERAGCRTDGSNLRSLIGRSA